MHSKTSNNFNSNSARGSIDAPKKGTIIHPKGKQIVNYKIGRKNEIKAQNSNNENMRI